MPTFANYAAQNLSVCDQLLAKTDWTVAQANAATAIGADGSVNVDTAQLTPFDLRPYREVHVYLVCNSITGGTTPSITLSSLGYPTFTPSANRLSLYSDSQSLSAAGASTIILTCNMAAITNTSVGKINNKPITVAYRPLLACFFLQASGTPTGLSVETYVYGVR
jgi:hypothetical protein